MNTNLNTGGYCVGWLLTWVVGQELVELATGIVGGLVVVAVHMEQNRHMRVENQCCRFQGKSMTHEMTEITYNASG
jgi:hypothetical protein